MSIISYFHSEFIYIHYQKLGIKFQLQQALYSIDEFTNDFKSLSPEKKYGYVYEIAKGSYGTKRLKRYCYMAMKESK